ncbi:MAG: TlpA disulfide reductase family protein [Kofleriaceae bacterium]
MTIVNGKHQAEFDASWTGDNVAIRFALFHATIDAVAAADGELTGKWNVASQTWGTSAQTFRATPISSPDPAARFDSKMLPGDPIDLHEASTTWRVAFPESGIAKLELEQVAPGVFNGTLLFSTGNVVYVAGNARGHRLRLSSLIGLSIYLFDAELDDAQKTLTGIWVAGPDIKWNETLVATRSNDFEVASTLKIAQRNQLFAMSQLAPYASKPLIIEVGGSWCDTCKHAAAALVDIYKREHPHGLEIVSLTYEWTDDNEYNKRQAVEFKRTYRIPWEVIAVDGSLEKAWDVIPPGLDGVDVSGFPITLFVNRDGTIRSIHASFAGPENPREHQRWRDMYDREARALVDSDETK